MKLRCIRPKEAWICGDVVCKSDGVKSPHIVFNRGKARRYFHAHAPCADLFGEERHDFRTKYVDRMMRENLVLMPCGKCAACQIKKRKDMSVRLAHEASQHDACTFLTLTYNMEYVPYNTPDRRGCQPRMTLCPADVQKFIKRLRRHLEYVPKKSNGKKRDHVTKIRYFAVGEYGGKTHRPHYHILIFGWKPSDADVFMVRNGRPIYRSAQVEKLWTKGYSSVEDVSPYVAKYCARYVTKKFSRLEESEFERDNPVCPEFVLQSTRDGGIGSTWCDKYGSDACKVGVCTYRNGDKVIKASIPRYYYNRIRRKNLPLWLELRDERLDFIRKHPKSIEDIYAEIEDSRRACDCFLERCKRETFNEVF